MSAGKITASQVRVGSHVRVLSSTLVDTVFLTEIQGYFYESKNGRRVLQLLTQPLNEDGSYNARSQKVTIRARQIVEIVTV